MTQPTAPTQQHPVIIQGGMGVGISNWYLANVVARHGHMGVVSGTAHDRLIAYRLQDGDPGGHIRRVLEKFPIPAMVKQVLDTYFVPGGLTTRGDYRTIPMFSTQP